MTRQDSQPGSGEGQFWNGASPHEHCGNNVRKKRRHRARISGPILNIGERWRFAANGCNFDTSPEIIDDLPLSDSDFAAMIDQLDPEELTEAEHDRIMNAYIELPPRRIEN